VHLDELARLRRRDLDKIRERIAAAGGELYKPKREGRIGAVNGLSVNEILIEYTDGHTELAAVWGQVFPVGVDLKKGTGRVSLSAKGDNYFQSAANNAVACDKAAVTGVDWASLDCVFLYPGAQFKMSGDSVGAADATALASALLNMPADGAVAMTGTIDAVGDVGDVGGVRYKARAALSNPAIRTLIIPNAMGSLSDLDALYDDRPDLFLNHHFIFVTKIGEVFRQAIIGYDPAYEQAQRLYRSSLSLFLDGEDEDALTDMQKASSLTPEDQTMKVWLSVMKVEEQKPVPSTEPQR
jgi:predicted ATP-dependent protease